MAFDSSDPVALDSAWPLVGRDRIVARTLEALRAATRTVVLDGPSGVGRSRVAAEVVSALEDEGWLTTTVEGNPALPPVPLATIAPALTRETSAAIARADDLDSLVAAASSVLCRVGDGRPILVVLDDAVAADPVSVALIARLVEHGRLRTLITLEAGHPVPEGLLGAIQGEDALRIEVPELAPDETEELLTSALGAPVAASTVGVLHGSSAGNPMFLRELVIRAVAAGGLVRDGMRWRLVAHATGSPTLRELVRTRFHALSHEERDVVERLSLCQPLGLDEFARPGAPEALAELEQRGLVRVKETRDRIHMRLAHPEYAAAVRETIPRVRHVTLLAQQADLVSRRSPSPADQLRVAHWRLGARRPSDPDLLLRSARLALEARDHPHAERLVSAAITSGAQRASDHLLHAQLLRTLSRHREALSALQRAEQTTDADEERATIAQHRAAILAEEGMRGA